MSAFYDQDGDETEGWEAEAEEYYHFFDAEPQHQFDTWAEHRGER